ncbi:MAG TPA: hypothetical protein VJH20_01530 [Candidatus Nanoarchaeia archaeon]|nr:hypothetical protein [Candidatus Nanoarchaeia archaeon]
MKISKILRKWRVLLLIVALLISLIAINPQFNAKGVIIKSVDVNSTATNSGITIPSSNTAPTQYERILAVNGKEVNTIQDYITLTSQAPVNQGLRITTNKANYVLLKTNESLGITIDNMPRTNIKKGLELQGGTRVLLKPQTQVEDQALDDMISILENRLNTYGLSDIKIKKAGDLSLNQGNKYILVEIAGATKTEVKELVASQGKFEAKIGDDIVFEGGKKDITFVCRNDGTCSGIRQCQPSQGGETCIFEFAITLSSEAAAKHAKVTENLDVNISAQGTRYLSKTLDLYLDGNLMDSLQISADLKGKETTQIAISGPGFGVDKATAGTEALKQMNKLQTILITGSLPFKLEIVKIDNISPTLGSQFVKNAWLIGIIAITAVALIMLIRYKNLKLAIPVFITQISEITLMLGFASLFKVNLDLAGIAGIIAAVGTGVDDQIVMIDEIRSKTVEYAVSVKERIKRAFFIIMAAWAVGFASMIPLLWAGAGLLTGFAFTTIVGISVGVFITRPAFAAIVETLIEE